MDVIDAAPRWDWPAPIACPPDWRATVAQALPQLERPDRLAQVLWQRQVCPLEDLAGWLRPAAYRPTPAAALGPDLAIAIERLQRAIQTQEKVAIWGDFDADGITATAVLWDGLGQLIPKGDRLIYTIPNRLHESHGLSRRGLEQLAQGGTTLVVTCDTGSTHAAEIAYAHSLGLEVIVTDHHSLAEETLGAIALINPRRLPPEHPLATLSGVAVAYKLLEGLYESLESLPPLPLEHLLDLVAIGLIADLVELRGDCRYLAQVGLAQLETQLQSHPPYPRPGLAKLLELCKGTGDRPTDISFGIGPRINAVSRIHGDASFCVELLTSQDGDRARALAQEAELANARRKALQRDLYGQVMTRLAGVDLATTRCLVLADEQWPTGILGLVAGQVAQALGRPTLLLRIDPPPPAGEPRLARGSARSVAGLDLYRLFQAQASLLTSFGGHPLAAGLTLPVENVELLAAALNQAVREQLGGDRPSPPPIAIDLTVTVAELGQGLFRELKWLEPCGMGNPVPRLGLANVWFEEVRNRNIQDYRGGKVQYIRTTFRICDDSDRGGFAGEWWGHYPEEVPPGRCDAVLELDYRPANPSRGSQGYYHVKLVAVRPALTTAEAASPQGLPILDWRQGAPEDLAAGPPSALVVEQAPTHWGQWQAWQRQAAQSALPLALAFSAQVEPRSPQEIWAQLVGLAKYLARTEMPVDRAELGDRLGLSAATLALGLEALSTAGLESTPPETDPLQFHMSSPGEPDRAAVQRFLEAVQEEQFRRRYFAQVPVTALSW
jgi:single-stranded-DNA-specific exonuclease